MTFIRAAGRSTALLLALGALAPVLAQTSTDDSGYTSTQKFRDFQAAGGGEEDRPTVIGRLEWLKARFGTLPADFS